MTFDELPHLALLAVAGALLLLLPGYALRGLFILISGDRDATLGAPDGLLGTILDSLGLSLAVWPLILLYGSIAGVRFSEQTILLILAVSAIIAVAVLIWRAGGLRDPLLARLGLTPGVGRALWPLLALTGLALTLRFIAVHYLLVPMWGDSLHHTLITQLFLDDGHVPTGYRPYAAADSFTYHFGFHSLAALWAWITSQTSWSAVISVGQILNALAVPAAYVLTRELFRSRLAGLFSAVVVGFLSGMPTYYVNWGRYTQLAGQVLLPFVIVWFLRAVENRPGVARTAPRSLRAQIALFLPPIVGAAGLGLTHYRVLIFFALFVMAYLGVLLVMRLTKRVALRERGTALFWCIGWRTLLGRTLIIAVLGGMLFGPWFKNLLADYLPNLFHRLAVATPEYLAEYNDSAALFDWLGVALPSLALLGFGLMVGFGPLRARMMAVVVGVWTVLLLLSTQPQLLGLPGSGAVNTMTVGIAYYLPLGTLAGPGLARPLLWLVAQVRARLRLRLSRFAVALLPLLLAVILTVANPGARSVNNHNAYMTPDDSAAMLWISASTPRDATFLISALPGYSGTALAANDAGMWIPLLTGRHVTVPPLSVGSEGGQDSDLPKRTKALYDASQKPDDPTSIALFKREGVDYIYIGQQTPTIPLTPLLRHPEYFRPAYQQGTVYIFEIR